MVDESFHLTPLDVRRYDFGTALRGYDKTRVDQFRDQVAEELERLARVTQELDGKAKSFHEQLRAFRDRDKALNEALVSAQQLRGDIREQADREGQLILREARAEGERMIDEARGEVRRLQQQVDALEQMRRVHLAQLRSLVQRQLTEIEAAEEGVGERGEREIGRAGEKGIPTEGGTGGGGSAGQRENPREAGAPKTTPKWLDASIPE